MNCLTWNLQWAPTKGDRARSIASAIRVVDPEVICYTEVVVGMIPSGHVIEADVDYGYPNNGDRRKVVLWSRNAWTDVDVYGDPELPTGRFASGVSSGIRFMGVCIPWREAHVKTGKRNKTLWEDHLAFCRGLKRILESQSRKPEPSCLLGDFNQRIPRDKQPQHVADALSAAILPGFRVVTAGASDSEGNRLIDHIAVSAGLSASVLAILPKSADDGTLLSDHVGVAACIQASPG